MVIIYPITHILFPFVAICFTVFIIHIKTTQKNIKLKSIKKHFLLIMSSTMNMFEQQVRQSMDETRDKSILSLKKRYEIIKESLIWVNEYASMLSASYT